MAERPARAEGELQRDGSGLANPDELFPADSALSDSAVGGSPLELDSIWPDDSLPDDASTRSAVGAPALGDTSSSANDLYDFTVACPLCGTRLDVGGEQVGTKIQCPDCHSRFVVHEPRRSTRRSRAGASVAQDDELRLSEPVAPPLMRKLADDLLSSAHRDLPPPVAPPAARRITPEQAVRDTLRQAEAEAETREQEQPKLPARPLQTGVMRFLAEPVAVSRWLLMSLAVYVEAAAIQAASQAAEGGRDEQVLGVFFRLFAIIFGVLLTSFIGSSLLVITEESADGRDTVEDWPGINVADWFFGVWPLVAALFLALAPGILLGQMAHALADSLVWFVLFAGGCGVVAMSVAFPVLLLSFLENHAPYSKPIWQSLAVGRAHWLPFWIRSTAIVVSGTVVSVVRWNSGSSLGNFLLAALGMLLAMVYFRLLGRLSWACDEALTAWRNVHARDEAV